MSHEMMRLYVIDEELKHYGVPGMKWGIRKEYKTIGRKPNLKPGDVLLKKGTTFQRIATSSSMSYSQGVFLSYVAKDKDLYRGVLGRIRVTGLIQNEPGEVKLKQLTMTANKDIRIPSKEKRIEELNKLLETNRKEILNLINEGESSSGRSKGYPINKEHKADNTMYGRFNHALALGVNKHPVIAKYYESLKKQGYDAIPDENDIRLSTFKARAPLIIFDTMDSIGGIKVRDLSAGEVFSSYNRVVGEKVVRNLLLPGGIGKEKLTPDSAHKTAQASRQQKQDKYTLNKNYTMTNLASNWGFDRLTSQQIRRVSKLMDEGKTHAQATAEVVSVGNAALDRVFSKFNL